MTLWVQAIHHHLICLSVLVCVIYNQLSSTVEWKFYHFILIYEILKSQSCKSGFPTLVYVTNLGNLLNCRSSQSNLRASNSEIQEQGPGIFILTNTLGNSDTGGPWTTYYGLYHKGNVGKKIFMLQFFNMEKRQTYSM